MTDLVPELAALGAFGVGHYGSRPMSAVAKGLMLQACLSS